MFISKPQSVKNWYAVNVAHKDTNLIPIPLGLANNYSPKNIRINDLVGFKFKKVEKVNKLYVNLRKSTNYKERENVENIFKNKEWAVVKEPNLSIDDYISDLNKYINLYFVLGETDLIHIESGKHFTVDLFRLQNLMLDYHSAIYQLFHLKILMIFQLKN